MRRSTRQSRTSNPMVFLAPSHLMSASGNYNEQIRINTFAGASLVNMVTFQSETGNPEDVVLHHEHTGTFTNVNYTIFIDGADFLTFQNLTIQADPENLLADDKNRVIYVENNSDNLNFINNKILSWYTSSGYFEYNECIFIGADYNMSMDNDSIAFYRQYNCWWIQGIALPGLSKCWEFSGDRLGD